MTIYIDEVLLENTIMNSIILLTTGVVCKRKVKFFRILLASVMGAMYVVAEYLSNLTIYKAIWLKVLLSAGMVWVSFYPKQLRHFLKQLFIFYLTSFCFGGTAYYLWYALRVNRHIN